MTRVLLEDRLRQAEEHVALGTRHIARQREIVTEFERKGLDLTEARKLLANFEASQTIYVADRDRLLSELTALR